MAKRTERTDQFANFRAVLRTERARLASGLRGELDMLLAPGYLAVEDLTPVLNEQAVALWPHRIDRRTVRLIDAALARLNEGEFGVCEECGDEIPSKRFRVLPWAAYCVPCQERFDLAKVEAERELSVAA